MKTTKFLQELTTVVCLAATAALFLAAPPARGQSFELLHSFSSGANPWAALVQGSNGDFYGTTTAGGANQLGTIFRMTPNGAVSTLVSFDQNNGAYPYAALVQGSDGNFYGTTASGGDHNLGTVFKMTPSGGLTTLVSFNGSDGSYPRAALVQGRNGDFYGTTYGLVVGPGGIHPWYDPNGPAPHQDFGTVFKITSNGILTTLVAFDGSKGSHPYAGVVQGTDGNFYGITVPGKGGTAFKMAPSGVLIWESDFGDAADSSLVRYWWPYAGLIQGRDGDFYGTAYGGGDRNGSVYKITPDGVVTTLIVLSAVTGSVGPFAALVQASDGNFYGSTALGPGSASGPVFKIATDLIPSDLFADSPGAWTTLVEFDGTDGFYYGPGAASNGANPKAALVQANDGNLYGTTSAGGANGKGTIFRIVMPFGFAGFLSPIGGADTTGGSFASPVRTFKMGSTIPVKFTASSGDSPVLTGVHTVQVVKYSDATTSDAPIDATPQDAATSGNEFRLTTDGHWQFNLDTKGTGMSVGVWLLRATLSDGSQHGAWIQIK